jgi:hypothetical protein
MEGLNVAIDGCDGVVGIEGVREILYKPVLSWLPRFGDNADWGCPEGANQMMKQQ